MLREIAAAVLLLASMPALAQQDDFAPAAPTTPPAKPKKKTTKAKPADTAPAAPAPALAPAAAATPVAPAAAPFAPPPFPVVKIEANDLEIPAFEDVDPRLLKGASLCIFPFIKEDKADGARAPGQNLERVQVIFRDVAKSSTLLKEASVLGKEAPLCGIEDTSCIASLGGFTSCTMVLAGRATREDNGYTLRARMIDTKRGKLIAKVNQVIATDDELEMAAWAEGQACSALKVSCSATVKLDADRADMRLVIDNKPIPRSPSIVGGPESLTLAPGIHKIRASIGGRTSPEITLAVRRNVEETVYVRQMEDGGIFIVRKSTLRPGDIPGPSRELKAGVKPTKVAGIIAAGLGVVSGGVATQQYFHSKSLYSDVNSAGAANGGYLKQSDLATINSAKNAHTAATALTAASAGLIVVGAVLFFAF